MDHVDGGGHQLAEAGGDGRALDPPVEAEHEDRVQHDVGHRARADSQRREDRMPVGLDEHLHGVGNQEAAVKDDDRPQVVLDIFHGPVRLAGAQQGGQPLEIQQRKGQDDEGNQDEQHDGAGEGLLGLALLPLAEIDRGDGRGPHPEQEGGREDEAHKRHGKVDRGERQLPDPVGHEQAVHHGVDRKNPHRGDRGYGVF